MIRLMFLRPMSFGLLHLVLIATALNICLSQSSFSAEKVIMNPAPTQKDWASIANLPDWSGVWNPKVTDQDLQVLSLIHISEPTRPY